MKQREFNAALKTVLFARGANKGKIDVGACRALPSQLRARMTAFIVRNRAPVLECLTPDEDGQSEVSAAWLRTCGYLHRTVSPASGMAMLHTAAHVIR